MTRITIAKKYAKALLEVGLQNGNYEALGQDLKKMADLLRQSKELQVALRSPAFPKPNRKAIGRRVAGRLGLAATTIRFIELLIQRKRINLFPEIAKAYADRCDEVAGRTRVTLATPLELPPGLVQEIKSLIESITGKEVILSVEMDTSLIGGVLVKNGYVIYDGSLRSQIANLKDTLCKE